MVENWITEAEESLGLKFDRLPSHEVRNVFDSLRGKYAVADLKIPLWQAIGDHASRRRANGWRDVGEFVGNRRCILAAENERQVAYAIATGEHLTKLLSECPGFVFYVTNEDFSYLLCHNDHDYLIGAGDAAEWVTNKADD